jgi:hypothetical protein
MTQRVVLQNRVCNNARNGQALVNRPPFTRGEIVKKPLMFFVVLCVLIGNVLALDMSGTQLFYSKLMFNKVGAVPIACPGSMRSHAKQEWYCAVFSGGKELFWKRYTAQEPAVIKGYTLRVGKWSAWVADGTIFTKTSTYDGRKSMMLYSNVKVLRGNVVAFGVIR